MTRHELRKKVIDYRLGIVFFVALLFLTWAFKPAEFRISRLIITCIASFFSGIFLSAIGGCAGLIIDTKRKNKSISSYIFFTALAIGPAITGSVIAWFSTNFLILVWRVISVLAIGGVLTTIMTFIAIMYAEKIGILDSANEDASQNGDGEK